MRRICAAAAATAALLGGCETAGELAMMQTIDGVWTGVLQCGFAPKMETVLDLDYQPGGAVTGTYTLTALGDDDARVKVGTLGMKGTFDAATFRLSLQPTGWIGEHLATGEPKPVEAQLQTATNTLRMPPSPGCAPLDLARQ